MIVFIPDKDSLFSLETKAREFLTAFNKKFSELLVPVFPLYIDSESLSEDDVRAAKNTFTGCAYSNILFDGKVFAFFCDIEFTDRIVSARIVFARFEDESVSFNNQENREQLSLLQKEYSPKTKSRIIRSVDMEQDGNSWTLYDEVFYKRKN